MQVSSNTIEVLTVEDYARFLAKRTVKMRVSEGKQLLKWAEGREVISFGGGLPDPRIYQVEELAEIAKTIILEERHKVLQYGSTEGLPALRDQIAKFINRYGIKVDGIENIIITTGSQQGLDLIGRILIDPGDVVLVEIPTYIAAINAFNVYYPRFQGIHMDNDGMIVDELEDTIKRFKNEGKRVKFVYTVPTCQNPAGLSLSEDRRKHLVELAEEFDFLIVEDDPYSYLIFDREPPRPIKTYDTSGRVIYMSTFSKILAPSLRVGFIVGDKKVIDKIALAKQATDLCTSTLSQLIAREALRREIVDKQIKNSISLYKMKRDLMLEALAKYMPHGCKWTKPIGGMFILAYAPEGVDTKKMLQKALRRGVAYVPGHGFFVDGSGANTMRLNFTYPSEDQIDRGISVLAEIIREETMRC